MGASIAVFKGDTVLLVQRGRAPFRGLWSLPGGSIEPGESASEAALRELKEETGITAEIEGVVENVELTATMMTAGRSPGGSPCSTGAMLEVLSSREAMPRTPIGWPSQTSKN